MMLNKPSGKQFVEEMILTLSGPPPPPRRRRRRRRRRKCLSLVLMR